MKKGFGYKGKMIYYIDRLGKDISFERWRLDLYYDRNHAKTVFFSSEKEYNDFIEKNSYNCYEDFITFKEAGIKEV